MQAEVTQTSMSTSQILDARHPGGLSLPQDLTIPNAQAVIKKQHSTPSNPSSSKRSFQKVNGTHLVQSTASPKPIHDPSSNPSIPLRSTPLESTPLGSAPSSTPKVPTLEEVQAKQRLEWLEKKDQWKWDIAAKVALVSFIVLSGASLFAIIAAPGGLVAGVALGTASLFVTVPLGIGIACTMDWTNYADPETVEKILNRVRNANTPVGIQSWNNLAEYGIISEENRKKLTGKDYQTQAYTLQNNLCWIGHAGVALSNVTSRETSHLDKQINHSNFGNLYLPKGKEEQEEVDEFVANEQKKIETYQEAIKDAKAKIQEFHSEITWFDARPEKKVVVQKNITNS